MSVIVGSLQVDVKTGQATFTLDEAKSKLDDFGRQAKETSTKLDYSMREARESVQLTGEAIGVHLPGGIARAIASIGPLGPALVAAMPVVAIVAAIGLIVEFGNKWQEFALKMQKAGESQTVFGSAINNSLRDLQDKLTEAGIKADDLSGNHLDKLHKELILIDHATLKDLESEFNTLATTADKALDQLKTHWYQFDSASAHAKWNLNDFQTQYENMLASGDKAGASKLLASTLEYEEKLLGVQKQVVELDKVGQANRTADQQQKLTQLNDDLARAGTSNSERDIRAQQELVGVLHAQSEVQKIINDTASQNKSNAITQERNKSGQDELKTSRELVSLKERLLSDEQALNQAQANSAVTGSGRAGLQQAIQNINALREAQTQLANDAFAEKKEQSALELKATSDVNEQGRIRNQLELDEQARNVAIAKATADAKKQIEQATLSVTMQSIEKSLESKLKALQQELQATKQTYSNESEVSKASFSQQESAIQNMEEIGVVSKRDALALKIDLIRREGAEKQKELQQELNAELATISKEIEAQQAAAQARLKLVGGDKSDPQYIAYLQQINVLQAQADVLYQKNGADSKSAITQTNTALSQQAVQLTMLGSSWSTYFARMKSETLDLSTTIRGSLQQSVTQFTTSFAQAMSKSIVEGKSFGQAMRQVAAQFLENMLSALIEWLEKWIITHTIAHAFAQSSQAAEFVAQKAQLASLAGAGGVASMAAAPFPIDLTAPAFGASMAAASLGMNAGGIVPGTGNTDSVPAILTPGEAVLPKPMVENLRTSAAQSQGDHFHMHYQPNIHVKAWDSEDMLGALSEHKHDFIKHVQKEVRRRNK